MATLIFVLVMAVLFAAVLVYVFIKRDESRRRRFEDEEERDLFDRAYFSAGEGLTGSAANDDVEISRDSVGVQVSPSPEAASIKVEPRELSPGDSLLYDFLFSDLDDSSV